MWTQKKIPKPLLVYFVAFFTYVTAGSFISQGCSPPASCTPQRTLMTVVIPSKLEAVSPNTNCVGFGLTTNPIVLYHTYSWRFKILVIDESNNIYSRRDYNSSFSLTTTTDIQAIVDDIRLKIEVPSCGKYQTQITVQINDAQRVFECNYVADPNNPPPPPTYMTWQSTSQILEGTSVQYLLGDATSNNFINYLGLRPIM